MYYGKNVAIHTLGCKLNFAESSAIFNGLLEHGYHKVSFSDRADYYIINTCSVTENADKECRSIVRSVLRINPEAAVVVIGCYAQLKPEEISAIPGVKLVLGASEKFKLHEHLQRLNNGMESGIVAAPLADLDFFSDAAAYGERTRGFLKVQDGCDYHCSFCTIPLARGHSRSAGIAPTVVQAQKLAATGVQEIVLTGVNIGDFGIDPKSGNRTGETFFDLIRELDRQVEVPRFRISSIEPNLLHNDIIRWVGQSERFMPHFHIPLQSGNDRILQFMRRKYRSALYASRVESILSEMPHACIGADVIVGFPGETDAYFEDTYRFLSELPVSYLHVFTYSERNNTKAAEMEGTVPMPVRKERNRRLRILSEKKRNAFYQQHAGTTRKVLFEAENDAGRMYGFTDNYIKVSAPYIEKNINQILEVELHPAPGLPYLSSTPLTLKQPA